MNFRVSGLPLAPFKPLFGLCDAQLAQHEAVRHTADAFPGYPCRVSLQDAEPGETLLLLNYEHLPAAGPYRSRYAIYVREGAAEAHPAVNEIPDVLRRRLLSVRALDERGMLRDAEVVDGAALEPIIARMLNRREIAYLHVHNARPGCYAARIDRAGS